MPKPWINVTVEFIKKAQILIEEHNPGDSAIITFDSVIEEIRLSDETQELLIGTVPY